MPSFLLLLLLLSLSLPTPISSHTIPLQKPPHSFTKQHHPTNSPTPTSKPPPNKKPISQFPKPNKPTNSTSTKSNLNKTLSTTKSNSTKITLLKSLNPAPKIHKILDFEEIDNEDLISDFHSSFDKLSTTSKLYLSKTHREISATVKPFVGTKFAPSIASAASSSLILLPLLLVTALFRFLIRTASLHRALLFAQVYLAVYFATLSLTAVVTGFDPLLFFYAAAPGAYAWVQAVQSFGYLVYLVAQLIVVVVAFSAGEGERKGGKVVGLVQMVLGLAVGMHYYITVFHRAVTGEAPRANWKVHGIYALCFVVISGLGRAERRKKAYLDGDSDGKKS